VDQIVRDRGLETEMRIGTKMETAITGTIRIEVRERIEV
jgi:hypothetical protein